MGDTHLSHKDDMSQEEENYLFHAMENVAVIGLSDNQERDSYRVAEYLQENGFRIIPVNPNVNEVLGEKAYKDLAAVPDEVDTVVIFRRPEHVPEIVEQAVRKGVNVVWMQEGIVHEAAAQTARDAGITVEMDACIMKEHSKQTYNKS